jgi:hypothetical protein
MAPAPIPGEGPSCFQEVIRTDSRSNKHWKEISHSNMKASFRALQMRGGAVRHDGEPRKAVLRLRLAQEWPLQSRPCPTELRSELRGV